MFSLFNSFAEQVQPIIAPSPSTNQNLFQNSTTTTTTNIGLYLLGAIIILAIIVIAVVCNWMIFSKLGEKGWKSIIPIYSNVVFLRLGNQSGWWVLVALVPFLGSIILGVISAFAAYTIGLKLHKPGWFVVLYILISPVWLIILAFSKSANADGHIDSAGPTSGTNMTPPPFSPATPAAPTNIPQPPERPSNTPAPPTQL